MKWSQAGAAGTLKASVGLKATQATGPVGAEVGRGTFPRTAGRLLR